MAVAAFCCLMPFSFAKGQNSAGPGGNGRNSDFGGM